MCFISLSYFEDTCSYIFSIITPPQEITQRSRAIGCLVDNVFEIFHLYLQPKMHNALYRYLHSPKITLGAIFSIFKYNGSSVIFCH